MSTNNATTAATDPLPGANGSSRRSSASSSPPASSAPVKPSQGSPSDHQQCPPTPSADSSSPAPTPKLQGVFYVVHGMGPQLEGIGKFDDNLKCLRTACEQVLKEEMGDSETRYEFIPIEWHSLFHALDT
ncbi:hypothetical protein HDV05_000261, partial [Chytridiales sp. JEL 0842]